LRAKQTWRRSGELETEEVQAPRANISCANFGFSRTVERESPIRDFRGYVASTTYSARQPNESSALIFAGKA
jgi:hypothetical protein